MYNQLVYRFGNASSLLKVLYKRQMIGFHDMKLCLHVSNVKPLCFCNQMRFASSVGRKTVDIYQKKDGMVKKILGKIPFVNFDKGKAHSLSYLLYESIVDKLDYIEFFERYELPDTFYSWFIITELHIWMWSVRAMAEGDIGRHIRNFLVEALWADATVRSKKLGTSNPSAAREQISILSEQLQAALIAYDEGLQTDDVILAGALWRRFYQQSDVDPVHIDSLVRFIRKQLRALDTIPSEILLSKEVTKWNPVKLP